jgi:hypothetical protein
MHIGTLRRSKLAASFQRSLLDFKDRVCILETSVAQNFLHAVAMKSLPLGKAAADR